METAEKRTGRGKKAAFLLAAALLLAVFCTGCKGKQKEENEASGSGRVPDLLPGRFRPEAQPLQL